MRRDVAFSGLVRLLRILRDTRTKQERIRAWRSIASYADTQAGKEEAR